MESINNMTATDLINPPKAVTQPLADRERPIDSIQD